MRFRPIHAAALLGIGVALTVASPLEARVVGVDLARRESVLDGRPFGLAGPYEKLVGTITYAVDPADAANRQVVDLDKAARNADGQVTFTADVYILKPLDPSRSNGTLLLEIPNRGGKGMLALLDQAAGSLDPTKPEEFGDGFLLERGFTLAWVGWQFDVRDEPGRMRLDAPRIANERGKVRADFVVAEKTTTHPIGHVITGSIGGKEYPPAGPEDPTSSTLTVRDVPTAPRTPIPRGDWRLTETTLEYAKGFEPGRIYELIYEAKDPAVVGLGLVAVRDFASWCKHDPRAVAPVKQTIAFGISQSGRFLRHFLYQGFNADEEGRRALDGVMAHVAGAGRGSFNHRFAQPSRDAQPREALFYPTDLEPFTDEGEASSVTPKIFYTNTSYEYWSRAGSLIHTTLKGRDDVDPPAETRIYHLAGLQHFSRPLPPRRGEGQLRSRWPMNPNPSAPTMRALVVAMHDWVARGVEPPASRFPRLDDGTLVPLATVKQHYPEIPDVELPRDVHAAYRMDYGPDFETKGILTEHPPKVGPAFTSLVPDVDADGNDRGGIRIPQLEVPVATYTPWNLRDPSIGAPASRVSFLGSYFPFARTKQDRERAGDPRPSLEERYASFDGYLGRVAQAAERLVAGRFLLAEDVPGVLERARLEWRYAHEGIDKPLLMRASELDRLEIAPPPDARAPYGDAPLQFGELRLPPGNGGPGPYPVAIIVHGGCWLAEYDLAHVRALAEAFAQAGIATWTIEYRRVGNDGGGWPGTFSDVARGADHLREVARSYPLDLSRVIAVGHSAGGQFALWLAARERKPAASAFQFPGSEPIHLRGVLGLAAAGDLAFLHEQKVCGHVIDKLMGGGPADVPERYAAGSPAQLVPIDTPQILLNGVRDSSWTPVAERYIAAARAAGSSGLRVIEAPESGHFEMIDPSSSTWPLVLEAARDLLD